MEENDKEDKLFKNLFGSLVNAPSQEEAEKEEAEKEEESKNRIIEKIKVIIRNLNEKQLNIINSMVIFYNK